MSYILEALRRSQAERERGQVPGLNAPAAPAEEPASGERRGPAALWLGIGLGLGAVAALAAWWFLRPAPAAAPAVVAPAAAVVVPAPAPAPSLPVVVSAPPAPAAMPAPPAAASVPVPVPASAPAARTPTLAELSPDQRREMPPLVMGGSIWSENALSRFVIVNGQVVREGEPAAPGVTVERIAPKAVTMKWRELRFEVPL